MADYRLDLLGQPQGILPRSIAYEDIPSDINKVYTKPLTVFDPVTDKQGRGNDPVPLSNLIPNEDKPVAPKSAAAVLLYIGLAMILFFVIRK